MKKASLDEVLFFFVADNVDCNGIFALVFSVLNHEKSTIILITVLFDWDEINFDRIYSTIKFSCSTIKSKDNSSNRFLFTVAYQTPCPYPSNGQ